jgi:hypothetical protein
MSQSDFKHLLSSLDALSPEQPAVLRRELDSRKTSPVPAGAKRAAPLMGGPSRNRPWRRPAALGARSGRVGHLQVPGRVVGVDRLWRTAASSGDLLGRMRDLAPNTLPKVFAELRLSPLQKGWLAGHRLREFV